jgi:hypothetical protein
LTRQIAVGASANNPWKKLMRNKLLSLALLCFLHTIFTGTAGAETPAITDIPLGTPDGFSAAAIESVGNGKYCVSGSVYDDAGPSESATVILVDSTKRRVLWKTRIPYAPDYVGNSATNCTIDGTAYYVLSRERTNSSEALNQTRITLNKLSTNGKLLRQQPIGVGFDEWSYLLNVRPDTISIVGGTSATLNRGGKIATFVVQFNSGLAQTKSVKLDSGAFWTGSSAKLNGQYLLVSGPFFPNTNSSSGHEGLATSKIDVGTSKYLWSSYVAPADARQAMSVFASDNTTYTAALTATDLDVSVVDHAGKAVNRFTMKKPLCSIKALTLDAGLLKMFGSSCKGQSSSAIATIDLGTKEVLVHQLDGDVSAPLFDGESWVGIVNTQARGEVLRHSVQ